ncbi:hypothetical protein DH2020_002505 [Rehmannia glutinosa]|uniref:Retrovirus-related Pol polyprotein from transposon TNT 1-94 n=1 Tax=Rehmannia glutinosa TaxID=99300 RepID=A0ABR0XTZ2_REHGL
MKNIPYASAVGSLMYAQVCTRPNIAFVVGVLRRYQSNPGINHWKSGVKRISIATSTMEAEFVFYFEATSHGVWLKNFISGLRIIDSISKPLKLYSDNLAEIRVKEKKVVIEHISIELMIVDPLTNSMPPKNFKDHVVRIGLGSIM